MSLFRIYKPKTYPSSSTRLRVLLSNHSFYGLLYDPLTSQHYQFCPTPSDVPNRPFSTSAFTLFHLLAPFKFPLQPLKFKASTTLNAKPFSSSSAPNGDDDHGVSSLTMVESESKCDFDVDVGKSTVGLLHSLDDDDDESCSTVSDSTMVELGNDTNEEGIVADSMVASDNNDDVGLERILLKCINHQSSSLLPKSNQLLGNQLLDYNLDDDDDESCSTVSDSTMVELGNDTNEEGIVVDSMVASDNNDDVGLERCEGHLNVASQDPVEVY
nr:hypothetical protein CFP56_68529 [Quercus suber]